MANGGRHPGRRLSAVRPRQLILFEQLPDQRAPQWGEPGHSDPLSLRRRRKPRRHFTPAQEGSNDARE
jgi:hypothetical protein